MQIILKLMFTSLRRLDVSETVLFDVKTGANQPYQIIQCDQCGVKLRAIYFTSQQTHHKRSFERDVCLHTSARWDQRCDHHHEV